MATTTGTAGTLRTSATQVNGYDRMLAGMAKTMWLPLLAMGFMIVGVAFIVGIVNAGWVADWFAADKATREAAASGTDLVSLKVKMATVGAFLPGFKFLGLGMLFSGIVMALANIINELRDGGARVQEAVGAEVKLLKKPLAGWLFPPLMMMGLMLLMGTFGVSWWLATEVNSYWDTSIATVLNPAPEGSSELSTLGRINAVKAWLAPLKFVGVAMLLTSITLALYTIRRIISFQMERMTQIARGAD